MKATQTLYDTKFRNKLSNLYNDYRTALYNKIYYGCQLQKYKTINLYLEITLAIGTSTAIGGWLIWSKDGGQTVWAVITGIAAVIAIIKPILNLPKQIERYSKLFVGHGDVFYSLEKVVKEVSQKEDFSKEVGTEYLKILERRNALAPDDDPRPNKELAKKCYNEVNEKIPPRSLWMPSEY